MCDHGFYFCAENFFEAADKVDLEFVGILQDSRVEEDLVGLAKSKIELVLVEQFFVGLYVLVVNSKREYLYRMPLRA